MARLDRRAAALISTEALARLLLRAESVASSRIEGLAVSPQRLLRADSDAIDGVVVTDRLASEVLANVKAMEYAIEGGGDITVDRLLEVHRRFLAPTRSATIAGTMRQTQNWIGGSIYNPIGADFVPPPPQEVPRLLDDLCAFCNDDTLPAVAQAAIAHARFETIHPFADGNGRTGRALTYMILRKRGLAVRSTPPIFLILATLSKEYVTRLNKTRHEGDPSSSAARYAIDTWVAFSALALVDWLPAAPILTVNTAGRLTKRTFAAANKAMAELIAAKILTPTKEARRNRTFEARDLVDAFTSLERQLFESYLRHAYRETGATRSQSSEALLIVGLVALIASLLRFERSEGAEAMTLCVRTFGL